MTVWPGFRPLSLQRRQSPSRSRLFHIGDGRESSGAHRTGNMPGVTHPLKSRLADTRTVLRERRLLIPQAVRIDAPKTGAEVVQSSSNEATDHFPRGLDVVSPFPYVSPTRISAGRSRTERRLLEKARGRAESNHLFRMLCYEPKSSIKTPRPNRDGQSSKHLNINSSLSVCKQSPSTNRKPAAGK